MNNKKNTITFQGNPLHLCGSVVEKGLKAPDFTVIDNSLNPVSLSAFNGSPLLIVAVPSLDTPVCDLEVRKFNEKALDIIDNLKIITVSMDLPFAQARWCGSAGIDRIQTLSDYKDASFGEAYGVLINELRLLARSIFLIDSSGKVVYSQLVPEMTDEPDYDEVISELNKLKN